MKTIYHPTLPGVSREVREGEASRWKAQGWRYTSPQTGAPKLTSDKSGDEPKAESQD